MSNMNLSQNDNIVNNTTYHNNYFSKKFNFVDANKVKFEIKCEIKTNGSFSVSGSYGGGGGQCQDHIKPANHAQQQLLDIWNKWHLNDMKAGTEKQEELLNSSEFESFKQLNNVKDGYSLACDFLESKNLLIDDGYKYGTAWLARNLPANFRENLIEIINQIEEAEQERSERVQYADDEELIEIVEEAGFTGNDALNVAAAVKLFSLKQEDLESIEIDGNRITVQGTEYLAGDDDEMDQAWDEDLENHIDDCVLHELPECYRRYFDKESFKDDCRIDGRAHSLNRYNGSEESEEINETTIYFYRQ